MFVLCKNKFVSSAKINGLACVRQFGRSLMYKMNNNGPRIDPCGTPFLILMASDLAPSIITTCVLLLR